MAIDHNTNNNTTAEETITLELTEQETKTIHKALKCYMDAQIVCRDKDGTIATRRTEDSDPWGEAFSIGYKIQNLWEDKNNAKN